MRTMLLLLVFGLAMSSPLQAQQESAGSVTAGPVERGDLFGAVTHYWGDVMPERMRQLGANWVRVHCSWAEVQPTPNPDPSTWNWGCPDQAMSAALQGFHVLYGMGHAPSWANGGRAGNYAPTGEFLGAWAHYCTELMRRYQGRGIVYEVWNEPNLDIFFMGSFDDYVNLVRAASQALRAVDPTGRLSGPETSNLNTPGRQTWHADAVSRLGSMYDVITTHWYCGRGCAGTASGIADQLMAYLQPKIAQLPEGVPLWLTETGLETSDDAAQALFYEGVLTAYQRSFVTARRRRPAWQNVFFYHLLAPDDSTIIWLDAARTPRQAFLRYRSWINDRPIAVPRKQP